MNAFHLWPLIPKYFQNKIACQIKRVANPDAQNLQLLAATNESLKSKEIAETGSRGIIPEIFQ